MKKNDVFTFTAPNGVEVQAVVIDCLGESGFEEVMDSKHWDTKYLCYAQNRLFYHTVWTQIDKVIDEGYTPSTEEEDDYWHALIYHSHDVKTTGCSQEIIVDYCVLPDYDAMLQQYVSMEYPQWEQNLEAEIQGINDR